MGLTAGFVAAFGGLLLTVATLAGFGGALDCGTWRLGCLVYATFTALGTQSLAALLLFSGLLATAPRSVAWYAAGAIGSISTVIALACGAAIVAVAIR